MFWRLTLFLVKTLFRNVDFWLWSIIFMIFWSTLGAFTFSTGLTPETLLESGVPEALLDSVWSRVVQGYTGAWYATLVLVSLGSTTSILVFYLYYSILPLRYLSKYSKASPEAIILGFLTGSLVVMLVSNMILLLTTTVLFTYRFNKLVLPINLPGTIASTMVYGIFLFAFSMTIGQLIIIIRRPRALSIASNFILILSLVLSMIHIYVGAGLINFSPINSAMSLLYHYYSGEAIPYDTPFITFQLEPKVTWNPYYSWIILTLWLALFTLSSIVLFKKQKGISAEEMLQS